MSFLAEPSAGEVAGQSPARLIAFSGSHCYLIRSNIKYLSYPSYFPESDYGSGLSASPSADFG